MDIINEALRLGEHYPVFPTINKVPCWSNKELKVEAGQGGYRIATQDPTKIKELFSHKNAREIAVPMGAMSGLLCVDVDLYKNPELVKWLAEQQWLKNTRSHKTRSGGLHFIFQHNDTTRYPATLREGVDVKAGGAGYICFPPTSGYSVLNKAQPATFPVEVLREISKARGGTGNLTNDSFNEATDRDLILRIQKADEIYPALRTLSNRLTTRRDSDRNLLTEDEQIQVLRKIMQTSEAANESHDRHKDWQDRYKKIDDLVSSANRKKEFEYPDDVTKELMAAESFIRTQEVIANASRPIGPQREIGPSDIEKRVAETEDEDDEYVLLTAEGLRSESIAPIKWIIEGMIPRMSTISLGGTSNVGKTRWLAGLACALATGTTERMGLPQCEPCSSIWFANEERAEDIQRRLKAVVLQHNDKKSKPIVIRGKDKGMMRLVALNEVGAPEIDTDNVARIVKQSRRVGAQIIILDPYITLSDAMDENSAVSASVLTKAFILIATLTGAAVLHAHHTPKDRNKDADWYRGDASAWRGSGAIYSALDCGYTLSHWLPRNFEQRKAWKQQSLDLNLTRWVVLDTGKIREGEPLPPVVYELVGQEMGEDEGLPIGVCELKTEQDAANILLDETVDTLLASELAERIGAKLGYGAHTKLAEIHEKMKLDPMWFITGERLYPRDMIKLHDMFQEPVHWSGGTVQLELNEKKKTNGRWILKVVKLEEE